MLAVLSSAQFARLRIAAKAARELSGLAHARRRLQKIPTASNEAWRGQWLGRQTMTSATTISDYLPVSVSSLTACDASPMNLYQVEVEGGSPQLYCGVGHPITAGDLARLRARGHKQVFIEATQRGDYQTHLRKLVRADEGSVDPAVRTGALGEMVRDVLQTSFASGDTDQVLADATDLGDATAALVCGDQFAVGDLARVLHHDYATFTHSANVALYAGMLARELGWCEADVQKITTGGLVHDLGKLEINDRILCKPGKLDEREFRLIKMHPTIGFDQLCRREDLTQGQLLMVYQHHERIDGRGYPCGVVDDEIHPWAKLCAVVDVYEALTSFRPYRGPMPRSRVLEIMHRDAGAAFDSEMLQCWTTITSRFSAS